MNLYQSNHWKLFRAEALRLAEERCTRCFKSRAQGAILHVHHKRYIVGRMPWEYAQDVCEVLCQSCHAQEHGIIPPKTDWELVGYEDLGEPIGNCDYCGTEVRHVFMIHHSKWIALEVGEICCDNLTSTHAATAYMHERRRFLERQKRFVSRWRSDQHGPHITHKNIRVRIVSANDALKLLMNNKTGKRTFSSLIDAKIAAFEVIDSGAAARYFQKLE